MRKNFGQQPWLYPMPVCIVSAYNEFNQPEAMAIGWGGILDPQHLSLCVLESHKTTKALRLTGAFTAGIADLAHLDDCDYVGTVSGNDVPNKLARTHFHTVKAECVNAPLIEELPMTLECTVESYNPTSGTLIGKIQNVSADEKYLNEDGKIDADRFEVLCYDPALNSYRILGRQVGIATQVCDPAQHQPK